MSKRGRQGSASSSLLTGPRAAGGAVTPVEMGAAGGAEISGGSGIDPENVPEELGEDDLAVFLEMSNEIFGVFQVSVNPKRRASARTCSTASGESEVSVTKARNRSGTSSMKMPSASAVRVSPLNMAP